MGLSCSTNYVEFHPILIGKLNVKKLNDNHYRLTGCTVFLKIMHTNEYTYCYNTSIVQNENDNSLECDGKAKDIFITLAALIDMPITGDVE
eukprot:2052410-Rhodomonas_salina.2